MPVDALESAYSDGAQRIPFATTISAPHMHAMTLGKLAAYLKPGAKVIDIGSGSGYVSACFAEMMGPTGSVIALDHV